jgi:hypothetical protein
MQGVWGLRRCLYDAMRPDPEPGCNQQAEPQRHCFICEDVLDKGYQKESDSYAKETQA